MLREAEVVADDDLEEVPEVQSAARGEGVPAAAVTAACACLIDHALRRVL